MQELNSARLSVSKVSEKEWNFIVDKLIDGYEEDAALPSVETAEDTPMGTAGDAIPNGVKQTIESDVPTTDTGLAAETTPSSRPASRAASRAGSRAGSRAASANLKPASRAGSLKPASRQPSKARSVSRGRSRTPGRRAVSALPMMTLTEEN